MVDSRRRNWDIQSERDNSGGDVHSHRWNWADHSEVDGHKSAVLGRDRRCGAYNQTATDYGDGWWESDHLAWWHNRAAGWQHSDFGNWNVDHRNGRVHRHIQPECFNPECNMDPSDG